MSQAEKMVSQPSSLARAISSDKLSNRTIGLDPAQLCLRGPGSWTWPAVLLEGVLRSRQVDHVGQPAAGQLDPVHAGVDRVRHDAGIERLRGCF